MTWIPTAVFAASASLLVYVVAGYPLLLRWLARRHDHPVRGDAVLRTVSIVIAVRNGENFLGDKLNSIQDLNYPKELMQTIVVSDGSDDRTDEIAASYSHLGVALWRIPRGGKAAALNLGISKARNEILVFTDVRQRLDRDGILRLVSCFGDPEVGAASGELSILCGETDEEADTRLYWNYEVAIRKAMSRIDSTFGANGPFYAMRRSLAVPIPTDVLLDDVYLPMRAFFQGYRIVLEPSAKAYDYPTSLQSEFKRKVRTQAGLWQTLHFYPQLLGPSNRMRFHFLSGKYGRLALPWLLLAVAASTPRLPGQWGWWAGWGQVAFYSAGLLDIVTPRRLPIKRLTSPVRTFVVLVVASLMSIRIFFVPPRELWKETQVRKVSG